MYHSITISGRNLWDYWHLIPTNRPLVAPPAITMNQVAIPGMDGFVDISEIISGRMNYGQRSGTWEFAVHPQYSDFEPWAPKYSEIMSFIHGKEHTIIFEDDPAYYYTGRLKVNQWQPGQNWSTVSIDYVLQPYKKELVRSDEEWLWDTFSFVDGIIRSYSEIEVDGSGTVEIRNGDERLVPEFVVSDSVNGLTVSLNGGDPVTLQNGTTKNYLLKLLAGDNTLEFSGNGRVTIRFNAGWL